MSEQVRTAYFGQLDVGTSYDRLRLRAEAFVVEQFGFRVVGPPFMDDGVAFAPMSFAS